MWFSFTPRFSEVTGKTLSDENRFNGAIGRLGKHLAEARCERESK